MPPLDPYQIVLPLLVCLLVGGLAIRVPRLRFVLLGFAAVVGYAVLQDQVSARLCPEYFTVLHRPIPGVTDPTLLGVYWGFLGGWWGGVLLGYAAGLAATLGPGPQLAPRELVGPILLLVGAVAVVTGLSGFSVWRHSAMLGAALDGDIAAAVPPERHRALLTVACYHFVAYTASAVGGVALCVWVRSVRRAREPVRTEEPVRPVPHF